MRYFFILNNYTFFAVFFSLFLFPNVEVAANGTNPISIPISSDKKSFSFGDSLIQVWKYEFQDTRLQNLRPHIFLKEDGLFYLFSNIGFFTFDRKNLYELPQKSLFPASNIDYSLLDKNGWLWLIDNNFNPYRPIFNIQFFNLETNEQKVQRDFFEETNLKNIHLNAVFQISSGEIVFSASDKNIYLYNGQETHAIIENKNWVLLGVNSKDEIILWDDDLDKVMFKSIYPEVNYRYLPAFDFTETLKECHTEDEHLICFAGQNMGFGIFVLNLSNPDQEWAWHLLPDNIGFSYNQYGQHYIYTYDLNNYFKINKNGAFRNEFIETIANIEKWVTAPSLLVSKQNIIFPSHNGLTIIRKVENKICNTLNNKSPSRLSSRGLKFKSENELWVSSYSGFHKVNFDPQDCTFEQKRIDYSCSPSYVHQTLISPEAHHKIQFSNNITVINLKDGTCKTLEVSPFGIDHIWDILHLSKEWYLLATFNGLYLTNLSQNAPIKVQFPSQSGDEITFDEFEKVEFFRLKYSRDSNQILAASSKGLFALNLPDIFSKDSSFWSVSEWIHPNLVVRDVLELINGDLLLASQNNGMVWVSNDKNRLILAEYNSRNALRNNFSHNILQDDLDRIWVSTNHGLYLIDLERNIWRMLGQFNGFPDNEFNYLSAAQSKGGLMAFGGLNGVSIFDPLRFSIECQENYFYLESIRDIKKRGKTFESTPLPKDSKSQFFTSIRSKNQELKFHFSGSIMDRFYSFYIRRSGTREWKHLSDQKTILVSALHPGLNHYEIAGILDNGKVVLSDQEVTIDLKTGEWGVIWLFFIIFSLTFIAYFFSPKIIKRVKEETDQKAHTQEHDLAAETILQESDNYFQPLKTQDTQFFKKHQNLIEVRQLNQFISEFNKKEILPKSIAEDDMDFVVSLKNFVLDSLNDESFSAELLASKMTVSYRQLHRLVTEKTGLAPNKFIALVKIIEGRRVLTLARNKNVKDITYYLGYSKPSHFSSLFKEVYGISPKKYQMKVKELIEKIETIIDDE